MCVYKVRIDFYAKRQKRVFSSFGRVHVFRHYRKKNSETYVASFFPSTWTTGQEDKAKLLKKKKKKNSSHEELGWQLGVAN